MTDPLFDYLCRMGDNTLVLSHRVSEWCGVAPVLEEDIDKAIFQLKKAMKKNYIVHYNYQKRTIYQKLRAHPDWPAIIAESNRRASVQREIYLKLVEEENKTAH